MRNLNTNGMKTLVPKRPCQQLPPRFIAFILVIGESMPLLRRRLQPLVMVYPTPLVMLGKISVLNVQQIPQPRLAIQHHVHVMTFSSQMGLVILLPAVVMSVIILQAMELPRAATRVQLIRIVSQTLPRALVTPTIIRMGRQSRL